SLPCLPPGFDRAGEARARNVRSGIGGGAAALFHFFESPGPVGLEEAGEGAIGEQAAAGLAARAVVDLVLGVDDPLHRRAADRARAPIAAVDGHLLAERGDVLGEALGGVTR